MTRPGLRTSLFIFYDCILNLQIKKVTFVRNNTTYYNYAESDITANYVVIKNDYLRKPGNLCCVKNHISINWTLTAGITS